MTKLRLNVSMTFCIALCTISQGLDNIESSFDGAIRVRLNSFFTAKVEQSSQERSAFQCTHRCLRKESCVSVVFCGMDIRGRCYLYNKGISPDDTTSMVHRSGCTFYQFVDPHEGCKKIHCQNGGTCYHDNHKGGFTCSCTGRFTGELCEKAQANVYRFSNLQQVGRNGPTSTAGYTGTSLDGKVRLNNGKQEWTVPKSGRYHISVAGASGGDVPGLVGSQIGGLGARVEGYVTLHIGNVLVVVVGQEGLTKDAGGGGGGSFVFFRNNTIIAIAGGGGGGGGGITQKNGEGGLDSTQGGVWGGRPGFGGTVCLDLVNSAINGPGGGAGFADNGKCYKSPNCSDSKDCTQGGGSYQSDFVGGLGEGNGGFGGGGGGGGSFPGGGGGYSGGGVNATSDQGQAGGGGSKKHSPSWLGKSAVNKGHGSVNITLE